MHYWQSFEVIKKEIYSFYFNVFDCYLHFLAFDYFILLASFMKAKAVVVVTEESNSCKGDRLLCCGIILLVVNIKYS